MKECVDLLRRLFIHARKSGKFFHGCRLDIINSLKVAHQFFPSCRPDARDVVENRVDLTLAPQQAEKVLGTVRVDPGILAEDSHVRPKAPGMRYKHYAPKADLTIIQGEMERVIPEINRLAAEQEKAGKKVGVICTDETREQYTTGDIKSIGLRAEDETIAHHLFAILRDFDEDGVEVIYSEAFDTPRMGQAIMNRLLKAAGHKVAEV